MKKQLLTICALAGGIAGFLPQANAAVFTGNGTTDDFSDAANWSGGVPSSTVAAEFYSSGSPISPNPSNVFLTSNQTASSTWLRYGITVNLDVRGNTLTTGYSTAVSYIGRASSSNTFNITNSTGAGTGLYSIGGGGTGLFLLGDGTAGGLSSNSNLMNFNASTGAVGGSFTNGTSLIIGYTTQNGVTSDTNVLRLQNGATFVVNNASANVFVGRASGGNATTTASGNAIEVLSGSSLTSDHQSGAFVLGYRTAGTSVVTNNNVLLVSGANSTADLDDLRIGVSAGGTGTINGNRLIIRDGGVVSIGADGSSSVGLRVNESGTNNLIRLGDLGGSNPSAGTLNVTNAANNAILRIYAGGGAMSVGANSTLNVDTLQVDNGSFFGDNADATARGFTSGTVNVRNTIYNGSNLFSIGDNSGTTPAIYNLVGNGTHTFANGLRIEQAEGQLTGIGAIGNATITTNVTNNGVIAPGNSAGTIAITGNLTSGASAIYNFEIASLSSMDQLNMTGTAAFAGTFNLTLLDGYMPSFGNSFDLFDFSSASGTFDTLNLASLSGGLSWDTSALYTTGTISVVPEPSTWALLAGAVAGLAFMRRRRQS